MPESSQPSQPAPRSRQRSPDLIALRAAAGVATPEEVRVLSETPRILGNGFVVPRPLSPEQWVARWSGPRLGYDVPDLFAMHEVADRAPPPERPAYTDSGPVILAHPGHEPPPAGKPGYRGGLSRG